MTDGPFKNLQLANRWKKFAESVQNDAMESSTKRAMACDAILRDVLAGSNVALLRALEAHLSRAQLDLDLASSIDGIFSRHSRSPFADSLQRELAFRLDGPVSGLGAAYDEAIGAAKTRYIREISNRIEEECIRSHELGDMQKGQLARTISQSKFTLKSVDTPELSRAIRSGKKNAFKSGLSKQDGIDEGPSL